MCTWSSIMTRKKDLKSLVRARMAKTGESYTAALRNVVAGTDAPSTAAAPAVSAPEVAPRAWHRLIETSPDEARALLTEALRREPRLTHFGIGVHAEARKRREPARTGDVDDAIERELQHERTALGDHLDEIAACADWIKRQQPIRSYNLRHTSYGYKHSVERWFDERGGPHLYVANGSFIAAALSLGFEAKLDHPGSPNVHFTFSERTVRAPLSMPRAPEPTA
jgi:hypothetical protein